MMGFTKVNPSWANALFESVIQTSGDSASGHHARRKHVLFLKKKNQKDF
jgi:hypothetical protein